MFWKNEGRMKFITGIVYGAAGTVLVLFGLQNLGVHPFSSGTASGRIYEKTKAVESCIDEYYQGDINKEELVDSAVKGMVEALGDKYSEYYTEKEYEELMKGIEGSYVGIGVTLKQESEQVIRVEKVTKGGPAERGGILPGDRIIKLDDKDVTAMKLSEFVSLVKENDNEGKTFTIQVERKQEDGQMAVLDKQVLCEEVTVESVTAKKIGSVGYIQITEFDKETDEQFEDAVEKMKEEQAAGLVMDVRDNGGGSLDSAIEMLDELLPEGDLITEKSKKDGDKKYRSSNKKSYSGPMVVLINGNSASASEIFAGTLQSRGAAKLVGTKSFGKGIVQTVLSLQRQCGGGLKLTTAEYFLPNGVSIHKKGLTPDVEVEYEEPEGEYSEETDNQLQHALQMIDGE